MSEIRLKTEADANIDTPPVGYVSLYKGAVTGEMKIKDDAGSVFILTGGVNDHGSMTGLADDDHTQYHNNTRGDARYFTQSQSNTNFEPKNANIQSHIASTLNPHAVTKTQVGLGNVPNLDSTDPANIVQDTTHRFSTDAEKAVWNGKQSALGFTPEDSANKTVNFGTLSDIFYPTTKAVHSRISAAHNDGGSLFFTSTASDLGAGRYEMVKGLPAGGGFGIAATGVLNTALLAEFVSVTGVPNATYLPAGVFNYKVQARQSAGTQVSRLYAEFYTRTVLGVSTLIGTSELSAVLTGSNQEITGSFVAPITRGLGLTDRLMISIHADVSGAGTAPDITLDIQGLNSSRMFAPFYEPSAGASPITSVNGYTGVVVLTYADVGPATGTANTIAGFDSSGNLNPIPGFNVDTVSKGMNLSITQNENGVNEYITTHSLSTELVPLQNSPDTSTMALRVGVVIDPTSTGFNLGTNGECATAFGLSINHQGTSDTGRLALQNNNFTIGNGTDPISMLGMSYIYGFGAIAANVTVDGPIQGYGFQPNVNAAAIGTSNFRVAAFYDFASIGIPISGYQSVILNPTVLEIPNNFNFQGVGIGPNVTTFSGNAGITGVNISPTIGTIATGAFQGIVVNPTITQTTGYTTSFNTAPTITLNKGNAVLLQVSTNNITNYSGVVATLVFQDITYTFLQAGAYNNSYTVEYTDTVTAGNEVASIAGLAVTVSIESGVTTATQVLAALNANIGLLGAVSVAITGTPSNAQVAAGPTNFAGGIDPGTAKAAQFDGDVAINGALSFTGGLSIGALNSFATGTLVNGGGAPGSIDTLITQPSIGDNITLANADLLAINTAMLLQIGTNSVITTSFLGIAALGLPAVVSLGAGSSVDRVDGAVFAISLDSGAGGGTIDTVDLCRAIAIPNGVTTVNKLKGYAFDLPFGDPGTVTHGVHISPASAHNYMAGDLKVGSGTDVPANSSVGIELESTTKAILLSRMTTTERNALTAVNGMQIYNTTTDKFQGYAAGAWVDLH